MKWVNTLLLLLIGLIECQEIVIKINQNVQVDTKNLKGLKCESEAESCSNITEVTCLKKRNKIESCLVANRDSIFYHTPLFNETIVCGHPSPDDCYLAFQIDFDQFNMDHMAKKTWNEMNIEKSFAQSNDNAGRSLILFFGIFGGILAGFVLLIVGVCFVKRYFETQNDIKFACLSCLTKQKPALREKHAKVSLPKIDLTATKISANASPSSPTLVATDAIDNPIFNSYTQSEITISSYKDSPSYFVNDMSASYHSLNNQNSFINQSNLPESSNPVTQQVLRTENT